MSVLKSLCEQCSYINWRSQPQLRALHADCSFDADCSAAAQTASGPSSRSELSLKVAGHQAYQSSAGKADELLCTHHCSGIYGMAPDRCHLSSLPYKTETVTDGRSYPWSIPKLNLDKSNTWNCKYGVKVPKSSSKALQTWYVWSWQIPCICSLTHCSSDILYTLIIRISAASALPGLFPTSRYTRSLV